MKFSKNQWIMISGVFVAFLIGVATLYFQNDAPQNIIDSPNSINTVNQVGDNVINNPPFPKPELTYEAVEPINQLIGAGQYQTRYEAKITSQFPISSTTRTVIPSYCSGKTLANVQVNNGSITFNEKRFEITCTTAAPIRADQISFSLTENQ